jgi:hypothetical protein
MDGQPTIALPAAQRSCRRQYAILPMTGHDMNGCEYVSVAELTEEDAHAVRDWLGRNQFDQVTSIGGPETAFGDQQDTWERAGTLVRLTRDRGQWWYDITRVGTNVWLDIDTVAGAMGYKHTVPAERVDVVASSLDNRSFAAIASSERPSP